jgi:MFS family permease
MIYGYTTGIIGGIKTPAVNHLFNIYTVANYTGEGSRNNWTCIHTNPHGYTDGQVSLYYGIFTADILIGNLIGAYLGPLTSEKYGRRTAQIVNGMLVIVSSTLMYFTNDFLLQVILRIVQGVAIGYCATVGTGYVSEIAPPSQRGQLGTLFQLFLCGFMAVGMLLNLLFNPENIIECLPDFRWKLQLSMAAVPGVIMVLYALVWMPESPKWLEMKSQASFGNNYSLLNNGENDVDGGNSMGGGDGVLGTIDEKSGDFLSSAQSDVSCNGGAVGASSGSTGGWSMLCSARGFKWLILVVGLPMAQQLTGINAIMFYGPTIIANMGFSNSLLITFLVVGVWNLLSVFVSFVLVDRLGRRVLMLTSLLLMGMASTVMGVLFHEFPLGSSALPKAIPLSMIMLFILAFESGPGPLFFVILNETVPVNIRKEAISLANMLQSGMNIMLSFSFPVLIVALGDHGNDKSGTGTTFFILSSFALLSFFFVYLRVPETAATIETDINQVSVTK